MLKVVVIAQTPPPFHGQAIMQQYLVDAEWIWCTKEHIRLDYSDSIDEVGKFKLNKILKLFQVLQKIRQSTQQEGIDLLYYPPAGPKRIPLYRDILTLLYAKLKAKKIVLHFHAGGLNQLIDKLSPLEKWAARKAFGNIDHAIVLSHWLQREADWFKPKKLWVIPNGIQDMATQPNPAKYSDQKICTILFVGNLIPEKGIMVLLKAATLLRKSLSGFRIRIMGETHNPEMATEIKKFITDFDLSKNIDLLGGKTGEQKWKEFRDASIFCLPTYATEAMPVSILEAMMFSLPVVSTNWRAIPDMITNGEEGFLAAPQDESELAEKLAYLCNAPALQEKMGKAGRKKYETQYTINHHLSRMEEVFKSV